MISVVREPGAASTLLDPVRLDLMERLREPGSAASLARDLKLPRQRLNYHLHELEKHGLIEFVEERKRGNCTERIVRAKAQHFLISPEALGKMGGQHFTADQFSSSYLIAASARTIRDVAAMREKAEQAGQKLMTLSLEGEVRFRSAADRAAFVEEISNFLAKTIAKYHDEKAAGGRAFRIVAGMHTKNPGESDAKS
jgi:DNA-binding transcriptional ArsR family regulator